MINKVPNPKFQVPNSKWGLWFGLFLGAWSLGLGTWSFAQQMPCYTQFRPGNAFVNPGVVGTKRIIDARINFRKQWSGFEDAPVTKGISVNGRLFKGSAGLGFSYFNDKTGPTKRSDLSLAYSYHAHFDDVELSAGLAYDRLTYSLDGTLLHLHVPYDNVIDLTATQTQKVHNASAGVLFYNDRFHLGISALNLFEPTINFYGEADTLHETKIHMVPHLYAGVGYNWSGQPDWIWENALQVLYAQANPMCIDYNLKIHYQQKVFGGISIRLRDAIAFHMGVTFLEEFHISYSYDLVTSSLRSGQSGSHELMLAWSSNIGHSKKSRYDLNRFKKQKYGFMF